MPTTAPTPPNPPRRPLTLALLQCPSQPGDVAANLERLQQAARQARAQGADLLLLPEMYLTGYAIGAEAVQALAQPASGAYHQAVARIARAHDLAIVFGYPERDAAGPVYNAAQWIDRTGALVLNYRKTHLYGDMDRRQFSAGAVDDTPAALGQLQGWNIGLLICYDVEFPENTRRLALAGADAVLVPTANMDRYDFVPNTLVPTRAFENQMVLAYANYCGQEGTLRYGGLSSVVDALGQPLAQGGRNEGLLLARLDSAALDEARRQQTHLREQAQR